MKARLGHYEIIAELGRGGMGVVYKGYEPSLARYVAIKELSPALANDEVIVERFLREARAMAKLNDPHIIQIYSIGQEDEQPFFVMEFVDGASIAELIKREGRIQTSDALKIVEQTAQGLLTAHSHGVVHRDIKPANMILSQRGQVKIADFGIALANHDMHNKLTSQGEFVGTPGYLAPEALLGKQVDQRSDVYALGVVLFEMLTGRTPFSNSGVYQLMLDSVQSEVPDVREFNPDVDSGVAEILTKMLHKNAADRYQSMSALLADLEASPLLTRGPIKLKAAAPASGDASTVAGSAIPLTPGATPQVRQPVKAKVASLPISSSSNREPPKTPATTPAVSEPHKFVEEFLESPESAIKQRNKSPKRKYIVAALFLLAIAGLWFVNAPGNNSDELMTSTGRAGEQQIANAKFAIFDIYANVKSIGVRLINPLLHKINLPLPAGLLFDVLMLLLAFALLKSAASAIFRRRSKKMHG